MLEKSLRPEEEIRVTTIPDLKIGRFISLDIPIFFSRLKLSIDPPPTDRMVRT
jgi:hypothetical protein